MQEFLRSSCSLLQCFAMKESSIIAKKKEQTLIALTERYYGKKDILDAWEEVPLPPKAKPDHRYIDHLRTRVRRHSLELTYRGVDEFVELRPNA